MNFAILILMIWWIPIFIWITVLNIQYRIYVRKHKIKRLQTVVPEITYTDGKLSDMDKLGEVLAYGVATFLGPITFFLIHCKESK